MKPNMAQLFGQVQKMQEEVEKIQKELENMTVEGSAGGGIVTVTATGKRKILKIQIDSEVIDKEDVEMLEDLIVAATNQALEKSQELEQEEMKKVAGGMLGNLPNGMKIPGLNL
ncbi:YbaB/EbfC family nucleoid-associated protein [bacterium]|nr:YbaB/EbfC family nucleoid-associated protein [bacterium]